MVVTHWRTAKHSVKAAIKQKRESRWRSSLNLDASARLPLMPGRKNKGFADGENSTETLCGNERKPNAPT